VIDAAATGFGSTARLSRLAKASAVALNSAALRLIKVFAFMLFSFFFYFKLMLHPCLYSTF
jgi:hypothetical protein